MTSLTFSPLCPGPVTEDSTLILSSTGDVAEYQGDRLGVFDPAGQFNEHPYWLQRDSLVLPDNAGKGQYLFYEDGWWYIDLVLDGPIAGLQNKETSALPPVSGNILPTAVVLHSSRHVIIITYIVQ